MNRLLRTGLVVIALFALVGFIFIKRQTPPQKAVINPVAERVVNTPSMQSEPSVAPQAPPSAETSVPDGSPGTTPHIVEKASKPAKIAKTSGPARPKDPPLDPGARAALGFVGTNPEAEDYWVDAINDPALPANERKDLIEDLNEDGLSNPDHPGMNDLPLIESRLQLIEDLAPFAMDKVNYDAFLEAYKDLSKMYADLTH